MNEHLAAILNYYGIDNHEVVLPNGQTALEYLEGAVMGAMDEIEVAANPDDNW